MTAPQRKTLLSNLENSLEQKKQLLSQLQTLGTGKLAEKTQSVVAQAQSQTQANVDKAALAQKIAPLVEKLQDYQFKKTTGLLSKIKNFFNASLRSQKTEAVTAIQTLASSAKTIAEFQQKLSAIQKQYEGINKKVFSGELKKVVDQTAPQPSRPGLK